MMSAVSSSWNSNHGFPAPGPQDPHKTIGIPAGFSLKDPVT